MKARRFRYLPAARSSKSALASGKTATAAGAVSASAAAFILFRILLLERASEITEAS